MILIITVIHVIIDFLKVKAFTVLNVDEEQELPHVYPQIRIILECKLKKNYGL